MDDMVHEFLGNILRMVNTFYKWIFFTVIFKKAYSRTNLTIYLLKNCKNNDNFVLSSVVSAAN